MKFQLVSNAENPIASIAACIFFVGSASLVRAVDNALVATDPFKPLFASKPIAAELSSIDIQRTLAVAPKYLKDSCKSEIPAFDITDVLFNTSITRPTSETSKPY